MSEIVRIPYKPKILMMLLGIAFFGSTAALFLHLTTTNEVGLSISGLIEFSPQSANYAYGVLFICSALFVFMGLWGAYTSLFSNHEVILTADSISAPKNLLFGNVVTINYSDIINLTTTRINGQEFLVIYHSDGKLNINDKHLPSREIYQQLVKTVVEKSKAA